MKQHWVVTSGLVVVFIFLYSVVLSATYYNQFDIRAFAYLELTDYSKTLLFSEKLPLVFVMTVISGYLLAQLFTNEAKLPYLTKKSQLVVRSLSLFLLYFLAIFIVMAPFVEILCYADELKSGAAGVVDVQLDDEVIKSVGVVGGTSSYLLLYSHETKRSIIVSNSKVEQIVAITRPSTRKF